MNCGGRKVADLHNMIGFFFEICGQMWFVYEKSLIKSIFFANLLTDGKIVTKINMLEKYISCFTATGADAECGESPRKSVTVKHPPTRGDKSDTRKQLAVST